MYEAAFVQLFRDRYLHRLGVSMPPHITISTPVNSLRELARDDFLVLRMVCGSLASFTFKVRSLVRFPDSNYLFLVPEPVAPFLHESRALTDLYAERRSTMNLSLSI